MKILIVGCAAEGKTTMANYIQKKLEDVGITSNIIDDDPIPEISPLALFKRLVNMQYHSKGLNITIETVQAMRENPES